MSIELDHIFVMCEAEAPEAAALARLGLVEGPATFTPAKAPRGADSSSSVSTSSSSGYEMKRKHAATPPLQRDSGIAGPNATTASARSG